MSLRYTIRESFSGFRRTKLSSILSVLTICVALLLLGVFAVITVHARRFLDELRDKVEIEAFLQEPLTRPQIDSLQRVVAAIEGVAAVECISKDEAARIFKEEFGQDIMQVLDFNPLPPSFRIRLKEGYKTLERTQDVEWKLNRIDDIESVLYRKGLLEVIDSRARTANSLTLALGILVGLSAVFLVSNTIRLAIYAKRQIIRTMELVGATRMFIRTPFLLEGVMQGLLGGFLAAGLLYGMLGFLLRFLSSDLALFVRMDPVFYLVVILTGAGLGLMGSVISVTRFMRSPDA
jgi:cell division transport system permease protein